MAANSGEHLDGDKVHYLIKYLAIKLYLYFRRNCCFFYMFLSLFILFAHKYVAKIKFLLAPNFLGGAQGLKMCLDNFDWGKKWPTIFFDNYFYIANLLNST